MINKDGSVHNLGKVCNEKDLGVRFDEFLTFEQHIQEKITKVNQIMGMIRRSFINLDKDNFTRLYKAQVRPHLEYAQSVWSPLRKRDIDAIENVQRRATQQIPELKNMTYKERLAELKLPTLNYRRLIGDMIEMYKIMQGKYDQEACPNIKLREGTPRGNNKKNIQDKG